MSQTGNPVIDAAAGLGTNLLTPEANNTPAELLSRSQDKRDVYDGKKTAGTRVTVEGLIEELENIAKLYGSAGPKQKVELLAALNKLIPLAEEKNVSLREARAKGRLDVFQSRETGYQSAYYSSQQQLYGTNISLRQSAMSGVTSITSMKGWIASIAMAINDFFDGALGEMPTMQRWRQEAESYRVNMSDINSPNRANLDFSEQPDAQINTKEVISTLNEVVLPALKSQAQQQAEKLGRDTVPTPENPSPLMPKREAGNESANMFADNKDVATTPKARESSTQKPGIEAAAMFGLPTRQPQ